jgi:hypothetical protein
MGEPMNPEERLRLLDDPERWDLPIQKRTDIFPRRKRVSPVILSFATIATVAVVGVVVFAAIGTGVRSVRHPSAPVAVSPTPTPTASVVRWADTPSDGLTTDAVTTDLVPACKADDVTLSGAPGGAVMGTWRVLISVKNTGSATCAIAATGTSVTAGAESNVMSAKWGGRSKIVPPGSKFVIAAEFSGGCAASPTGEQPPVASAPTVAVTFVVPGIGRHEIPAAIDKAFLYCGVSQEVEWLAAPDPAPASGADDLAATIDGPYTTQITTGPYSPIKPANGRINYTVTLTNLGTSSYDFGSYCPTFVEAVSIGGESESPKPAGGYPKSASAQSLPCSGLPSIAPGGSRTFAMELAMPANAEGAGPLVWSMTDGPNVTASVDTRF